MKKITFKGWHHRKLGEIRKAKFYYDIWHTGQETAPARKLRYLQARMRREMLRDARATWFPLFHTGQETAPGRKLRYLQARHRVNWSQTARAQFFPIFHVIPPAPSVNVLATRFLARQREQLLRTARAQFFPTFRTGQQPSREALLLRTRRRRELLRDARAIFFTVFNTGLQTLIPQLTKLRTRQPESSARPAVHAKFFQLFNTGAQPPANTQVKYLRTRPRLDTIRPAKANFFPVQHFVIPPPPTATIPAITRLATRRPSTMRRIVTMANWFSYGTPFSIQGPGVAAPPVQRIQSGRAHISAIASKL